MIQLESGPPQWRSKAWDAPNANEAKYKAPWMDWFRGGHFRMTRLNDRILAHGEVDMKRSTGAAGLPFFDLFKSKK